MPPSSSPPYSQAPRDQHVEQHIKGDLRRADAGLDLRHPRLADPELFARAACDRPLSFRDLTINLTSRCFSRTRDIWPSDFASSSTVTSFQAMIDPFSLL